MAQILNSYIAKFELHSTGHIRSLLALWERYESDGEGVEEFDSSPDRLLESRPGAHKDESVGAKEHKHKRLDYIALGR
jgi:hypothetical protein